MVWQYKSNELDYQLSLAGDRPVSERNDMSLSL